MFSEKEFIKDRNEAFASGDKEKLLAYCKKYNIHIPKNEDTFWAGIHKAICNLYLIDNSPISIEQYNESYDWLIAHGCSPSLMGGEEECSEN